MKLLSTTFLLAMVVTSTLGASDATAQAAKAPAAPATAGTAGSLSESEALATLAAIDAHEIAAAKQARGKKPPAAVDAFAKMMQGDHNRNLAQTRQVAGKAKDTLVDTAAIKAMKAKGDADLAHLASLSGDAYAKAYMDAMVSGHADALAKLDAELIPAARNAGVKSHLAATRTAVAAHLEHAKSVRAGLH